jgi:hypothetical protein
VLLRRSTAARGNGKPAIEPLGRNGVGPVGRRIFREAVFLWMTPKLRDVFTARMAKTFAGKGKVNGWVGLLPPVPRSLDRYRYAPIPVWRRHRRETPAAPGSGATSPPPSGPGANSRCTTSS